MFPIITNEKQKAFEENCIKIFTYSEDDEYQDANGALYDTVTRSWRD